MWDNRSMELAQYDIFNRLRTLGSKGKPLNERSELIGFFANKLNKEPKVIGIRLGRYDISELYLLKSMWNDRENRQGMTTAQKWFWWETKTVKELEV